jgi:microsomal dipeptidase-like Zn-dependent dipeptidase
MSRRSISSAVTGVLVLGAGGLSLTVCSPAWAQQPEIRVVTTDSAVANHPSATLTLPAPYKVVGGGARANWRHSGSLLTQSQPGGPGPNAWVASSKDHFAAEPVSLSAFAIGLADPADEWEVIVREARSPVAPQPVATAKLPPGYAMTGGGCLDEWRTSPSAPGNLLTASFPSSTNSWECRGKDHGAENPASIVAYVIGIRPKKPGVPLPEVKITTAHSPVAAHPTVVAPAEPGFIVTGGGAAPGASESLTLSTTNNTTARPMRGQVIRPQPQAPTPPGAGQLLTATHPELAPGSTVANGWRAAAKDHVYTSPGTLVAYAVNLRFPPPQLVATTTLIPALVQAAFPLRGWVDLHTHPMIHLAFGGKVIHGGVDEQSPLPTNIQCVDWQRAGTVANALSDDRPSHGGWDAFSFRCGDEIRKEIIGALQSENGALVTAGGRRPPTLGWPNFETWPAWNDITHQKMWWEWIKRARDGGLRVMVALATNNRTLGDAVSGNPPTDDKASGNLQIGAMKEFVERHRDFMEVAYTPARLKEIVQANKIAVILGVELDNLGALNQYALTTPEPTMQALARSEIQALYDQGVRYVLPIHLVNNRFGGAAIYQPTYSLANLRETGDYFRLECSVRGDGISFKHPSQLDTAVVAASLVKLGLYRPFTPPPQCPRPGISEGSGHRNSMGLLPLGRFAIVEMMKKGMIIDIDHMSDKAVDEVLALAESIDAPRGYPISSGHSGLRGMSGNHAETSRSESQLRRILRLHGMFGVGTDGTDAFAWSRQYQSTMHVMGFRSDDPSRVAYRNGAFGFGSDLNGLVKGPKPPGTRRPEYERASYPMGPLAPSRLGNKQWDYVSDGVAHYGLLPDFIRDVSSTPRHSIGFNAAGQPYGVTGAELVDQHLLLGAEYFYRMWERSEAQKGKVP